jgi:hypothetical protein
MNGSARRREQPKLPTTGRLFLPMKAWSASVLAGLLASIPSGIFGEPANQ